MIELSLFHEIPKRAEFHSIILTSYSFDFHYFESQVLRVLKSKGIVNIIILVDSRLLDQSMGYVTGGLRSLNKSYSLIGIEAKGAFHPKLAVLAGEDEIMLLQGSGNITYGGHGRNHELFGAFCANEQEVGQQKLIVEAWNYCKQLASGIQGISAAKVKWIEENSSLLQKPNVSKHQWVDLEEDMSASLLYNEDSSIYEQLIGLVPAEEVSNIKVFSPFYDESGLLINRLVEEYSNAQFEIYLQKGKGIHPHKLEKNKSLTFSAWSSTKRSKEKGDLKHRFNHSKVYYFQTEKDQYLLFGSPNASVPAFGYTNRKAANEEFAILLRSSNTDFLKELGLRGKRIPITPQDHDSEYPLHEEGDSSTNKKRPIYILSADLANREVLLYLEIRSEILKAQIVLFDAWGNQLQQVGLKTQEQQKVLIEKSVNQNDLAFVQVLNSEGHVLSNKQAIHRINNLINTNPSNENRRLLKLKGLIELGTNKPFDIINYFSDLYNYSSHNKDEEQNKIINHADNAITLGGEKESKTFTEVFHEDWSSQKDETIETTFNSVQILEATVRFIRQALSDAEEAEQNDEELAQAEESSEREIDMDSKPPIKLKSINVLEQRQKKVVGFIEHYIDYLDELLDQEGKEINMADLAMIMIVIDQLIDKKNQRVIIDDKSSITQVILPAAGNFADYDSFTGGIINCLGAFINLLVSHPLKDYQDGHNQIKLENYKLLVLKHSLYALSIIDSIYKNHLKFREQISLIAFNLFHYLNSTDKILDIKEETMSYYLKLEIGKEVYLNKVKNWLDRYHQLKMDDHFFVNSKTGICFIEKKIPDSGASKFLRLSRIGFEYNEKVNWFVKQELFDLKEEGFKKTLQNYRRRKTD